MLMKWRQGRLQILDASWILSGGLFLQRNHYNPISNQSKTKTRPKHNQRSTLVCGKSEWHNDDYQSCFFARTKNKERGRRHKPYSFLNPVNPIYSIHFINPVYTIYFTIPYILSTSHLHQQLKKPDLCRCNGKIKFYRLYQDLLPQRPWWPGQQAFYAY